MGDAEQAEEGAYRSAVSVATTLGEDGMLGRALSLLGLSQLARGDLPAGRRSVLEGVRVNLRSGRSTSMAYSLEGLAALALAEDRPAVAARSLAAAAAARGGNALPLSAPLPPLVDLLFGRAREMLGDDAFNRSLSDGRRCSLRQALDRALEDLSEPTDQDGDLLKRDHRRSTGATERDRPRASHFRCDPGAQAGAAGSGCG